MGAAAGRRGTQKMEPEPAWSVLLERNLMTTSVRSAGSRVDDIR